jgi:hypothetical protein
MLNLKLEGEMIRGEQDHRNRPKSEQTALEASEMGGSKRVSGCQIKINGYMQLNAVGFGFKICQLSIAEPDRSRECKVKL